MCVWDLSGRSGVRLIASSPGSALTACSWHRGRARKIPPVLRTEVHPFKRVGCNASLLNPNSKWENTSKC